MFVDLEFGKGMVVIGTCELDGRHGVVIAPSQRRGELGEDASDQAPFQGGIILWFQTKERADNVRDVLAHTNSNPT